MFHQPLAVMNKAESNTYLRAAIDTPEYRQAVALRADAMNRRANLPAAVTPTEPTSVDQLDDYLDAVTRAHAAERERELQHNALTAVINRCEATFAAQIDVHTDRILATLSADLADLMTNVDKHVTRLDGAYTAAQVIAAGAGDTWNELTALRRDYDQIRDAQKFVMADDMARHASRHWYDDPMASRLVIRNIDDLFPEWRDGGSTTITIGATTPEQRPWPVNDATAQLIWLSTSAADVWLPTLQDLEELENELRRKRNPTPAVIPGRSDKPTRKRRPVARIS